MLCCPVHDAVLVEADVDSIDEAIALTRDCMATASTTLLDGLEIGTEVVKVIYPGRYVDVQRGLAMWEKVTGIVDQLEWRADCDLMGGD